MFQVKDFRSIVASMVNHVRATTTKITDFRVGGVARTLLEAPAIEIDELYQQMFNGLREAIPAALYPPFGFGILPATPAVANLRFSVVTVPGATPVVIPAGTTAQVPGSTIRYATSADAVIASPQTAVMAIAVADVSGSVGNVAAQTITRLVSTISGVSVINDQAVISGRDTETGVARKNRFMSYVDSIARSHVSGIGYGASTAQVVDTTGQIVEYVKSYHVDEPYERDSSKPLGYVDVYIYNGVSSASAELVSSAQHILDGYYDTEGNAVPGYKGAGIIVTVKASTEQYVSVTGTVTLAAGYTLPGVAAQIRTTIGDYISGLQINANFILSKAIERAMEVPGVSDFVLTAPAANTAVAVGVKLLAGNSAIT